MVRGAWFLVCFILVTLLVPLVHAETCQATTPTTTYTLASFTDNSGDPGVETRIITGSAGKSYARAHITFDFKLGDIQDGPHANVLRLFSETGNIHLLTYRDNIRWYGGSATGTNPARVLEPFNWQWNTWYSVDIEYDVLDDVASVTISDGTNTVTADARSTNTIDNIFSSNNLELRLAGWDASNLPTSVPTTGQQYRDLEVELFSVDDCSRPVSNVVVDAPGEFTVNARERETFNFDASGASKIIVEFTATSGGDRTNLPWGPGNNPRREYGDIGGIGSLSGPGYHRYIAGVTSAYYQNGPEKFVFNGRDSITSGSSSYGVNRINYNWPVGTPVQVKYVYDIGAGIQKLESPMSSTYSIPNIDSIDLANMQLGFGQDNENNPHYTLDGWRFSNVKVTVETGSGPSGGNPSGNEGLVTITQPGLFHTSTSGDMTSKIPLQPPNGDYERVDVKMDFIPRSWNAGVSDRHGVFWLVRGKHNRGTFGQIDVRSDTNRIKMASNADCTLSSCDEPGEPLYPDSNAMFGNVDLELGERYSLHYIYDRLRHQMTLTVTDSEGELVRTMTRSGNTPVEYSTFSDQHPDGEGASNSVNGAGFQIWVGSETTQEAAATTNWEFYDLEVEFYPEGTSIIENPRLDPPEGTIWVDGNGEPGNILHYEGPWTLTEGDSRLSLATNDQNLQGYEEITVSFDMEVGPWRTEIERPFHSHFSLRNLCSQLQIMSTEIRRNQASPLQVLDSRGLPDGPVSGDVAYETGETYHVEATLLTEPATISLEVTDESGNSVYSSSTELNADPDNMYALDHTKEGFLLTLGADKDYPEGAWYRALGWTYSNMRIDTVEGSGEPIGSTSGELDTPEGRLAFLAANMAALAQGDDFSLDCGPGEEVLPLNPGDAQQGYCVLRYDDEIIFGTGGTTQEFFPDTISEFSTELFSSQIDPEEIEPDACGNILTESLGVEFVDCNEGSDGEPIPGFNTYGFYDPLGSEAAFIIVSQNEIDALSMTALEAVVDFFRGLFGLPPTGQLQGLSNPGEDLPLQKFHHAFFSKTGDKEISATWHGDNAVLLFKMFSTDFSELVPEGDDNSYTLSESGQVIRLEIERQNQQDWKLWRQLTSAVRVGSGNGPPIGGDVCGNELLGFEEQCEPLLNPERDCSEFGIDVDAAAICIGAGEENECSYDLNPCGVSENICIDDWFPPGNPGDEFGCTEGYCWCNVLLWNAMHGIPFDIEDATSRMGSDGGDVPYSPGSQNMPVICGAAAYVQEGDVHRDWWLSYYSAQENERFLGTELLSPVYYPSISASSIVVHNEAKARGDAELAEASASFLKGYFALAALGTTPQIPVSHTMKVAGGEENGDVPDSYVGYTASYAGTRVTPGSLPNHGNNMIVSLALGQESSLDWQGAFGRGRHMIPIGHILTAAGFSPDENGDVDWSALPSPLPADVFGLTEEERTALNGVIANDIGTFNTLANMVGGRTPVVPVTFVRTEAGNVNWFGTYEDLGDDPVGTLSETQPKGGTGHNANGNKANYFSVKMLNSGEITTLHPHNKNKVGKMTGDGGRFGNSYYAKADGNINHIDFQDLVDSGVRIVAQWDETGLHLVSGNLTDITHNAQGIWTGNPGARSCAELSGQFISPVALYDVSCGGETCMYCEDTSLISYMNGQEEITFMDLQASTGSCSSGYSLVTSQNGYNICKKPVTLQYSPGSDTIPVLIDITGISGVPDPMSGADAECRSRWSPCNGEGITCRSPGWFSGGSVLHCAAIKNVGFSFVEVDPNNAGSCQTSQDCPGSDICNFNCVDNRCQASGCNTGDRPFIELQIE